MIIVDRALEEREAAGRPIRVGVIGAGHMGRPMIAHILRHLPGMTVTAVSNRTTDKARRAFEEGGIDAVAVDSSAEADDVIAAGGHVYSDDPSIVTRSAHVDAVIEVTGHVAFAAQWVTDAIAHGKHVVLQNAELDGTIGPLLKHQADAAGVIVTQGDGDQPGVTMNLMRHVKAMGLQPLLLGNCKGMIDAYRTPATQAGFAAQYGLTPEMATNFADGTKLGFEMALIANASGQGVLRRGMTGPACGHVDESPALFDAEALLARGGCVDYILGAEPGPGVFVLGYDVDPKRTHYLNYLKLGDGPLYAFYTPWHLPHLETPLSVARAVLFNDPTCTPIGRPVCEVTATAKRALKAGQTLDGIGGFDTYGVIDNAADARAADALPIGIAQGAVLTRDVAKDALVTRADVTLADTLPVRLRAEQDALFAAADAAGTASVA